MVATTAFVLGFVILGLGTVFVAMRAGGGAPRSRAAAVRAYGLTSAALLLGILLFAAVIPGGAMIGNAAEQVNNGPGGVQLTEAQVEGREIFIENCATCHTLEGAAASGRVGPNLDVLRPNEQLTLNAIELGRAQGRGQMPALLVTGDEAKKVASFVATVAGR